MDTLAPLKSSNQILGVTRDTPPDDVARAYVRMAVRFHPARAAADDDRHAIRARFVELAEAWASLADGAVAKRDGDTPEAKAMSLFEQTLGWHALTLACQKMDEGQILKALMDDGCPQSVAWPVAEAAVKLRRLGAKPRPLMIDKKAIAAAAAAAAAAAEPDPETLLPNDDAGIAHRVAAGVADLLALLAISVPAAWLLGETFGWSMRATERFGLLVFLVAGVIYHVRGEAETGSTPGKRLVGLYVERLDGGRIDARTAMLRHGLRTVSHCLLGVGLLTVAITPRRQALHDLLTETRVRHDVNGRDEFVPVLCALPGLAALGALGWLLLG